MNFTRHASERTQQRGFSKEIIEIILKYGGLVNAGGGAIKVRLGKKEHQRAISELKKTIQILDKAKGGNLIIGGDDVITLYKN